MSKWHLSIMPLMYLPEGVAMKKNTEPISIGTQGHLSGTSARIALGRYPERGRYDAETIAAILDEGLVCHTGFQIAGQPYVIPTTYGRIGDQVYIHGSPVARWLRALAEAIPLCITVTLLDGLVFARSAFRHSMNYRSVVILGRASIVEQHGEKLAALSAIVEHMAAARWSSGIRHPSESELRATLVLRISLSEASAKVREGPPRDLNDDLNRPVWAGELPLNLRPDAPIAHSHGIELPAHVARWRR
jgi:nitroimidazol reductase NimA-like FMN-containing flavoprotein (pyridoxamine 5'-phosphate oxidase superfamily)